MKPGEFILYNLSKRWPSPVKSRKQSLGNDPDNPDYGFNYAIKMQYDNKVKNGIGIDIRDKRILEIGCGHGGISLYMALNGAKKVTGIDINIENLTIAKSLALKAKQGLGMNKLFLEFLEMDASDLCFDDSSFDVIIADNVFEHFTEPEKVLKECYNVLSQNGVLIVPVFSSIYSKNGLHLKHGIKIPWTNIFFSEKTICKVMERLSNENSDLIKYYPGLVDRPNKVRNLRRYKDLNDITYNKFKKMANNEGFRIISFDIFYRPYKLRKIISNLPFINRTILGDILSSGASATLIK